jgi:hypothetical protein
VRAADVLASKLLEQLRNSFVAGMLHGTFFDCWTHFKSQTVEILICGLGLRFGLFYLLDKVPNGCHIVVFAVFLENTEKTNTRSEFPLNFELNL